MYEYRKFLSVSNLQAPVPYENYKLLRLCRNYKRLCLDEKYKLLVCMKIASYRKCVENASFGDCTKITSSCKCVETTNFCAWVIDADKLIYQTVWEIEALLPVGKLQQSSCVCVKTTNSGCARMKSTSSCACVATTSACNCVQPQAPMPHCMENTSPSAYTEMSCENWLRILQTYDSRGNRRMMKVVNT